MTANPHIDRLREALSTLPQNFPKLHGIAALDALAAELASVYLDRNEAMDALDAAKRERDQARRQSEIDRRQCDDMTDMAGRAEAALAEAQRELEHERAQAEVEALHLANQTARLDAAWKALREIERGARVASGTPHAMTFMQIEACARAALAVASADTEEGG